MRIKIILSVLLLSLMTSAIGQNNTVIDSLVLVLKTAKEDTVKVINLNLLCWQYIGIRDYEIAMKNAESALLLAGKLEYKKGKAVAYITLAAICRRQGKYPEAVENYFAALKIREEIGDKNGIVDAYNNIGLIYRKQGNYPGALENYFAALKVREEIGDKRGIADSYNSIGMIYRIQGNNSEALKNSLAALKISNEFKYKQLIASSSNNIGLIYASGQLSGSIGKLFQFTKNL